MPRKRPSARKSAASSARSTPRPPPASRSRRSSPKKAGSPCPGRANTAGRARPHLRQLVYNEEMAYHQAPGQTMGTDRVGPTIILFGTEEQKADFLPRIVRDELRLVPGLQRARRRLRPRLAPDARRPRRRRLRHQRPEDLDLRRPIRRLDVPARPHRPGRAQAPRHHLLPPRHEVARHHRPPARPHGRPGTASTRSSSKTCACPPTTVVGEENRGWYVATTTLDFERSSIGRAIGGLRTFEQVADFARQRQPAPVRARLFDNVSIRHALADIGLSFRVGRLLSYRVAWMQSRQLVPNYEASMAKTFGTELHQRLARIAINTLGMAGQLRDPEPHPSTAPFPSFTSRPSRSRSPPAPRR